MMYCFVASGFANMKFELALIFKRSASGRTHRIFVRRTFLPTNTYGIKRTNSLADSVKTAYHVVTRIEF